MGSVHSILGIQPYCCLYDRTVLWKVPELLEEDVEIYVTILDLAFTIIAGGAIIAAVIYMWAVKKKKQIARGEP